MKKFILLPLAIMSINAMAIAFFSEADVVEKLQAEKAIQVSKYAVETLIQKDPDCADAYASRSARAYVVKKDDKAALYLTKEGLDDLKKCTDL